MKREMVPMDGNTAAAWVAHATNEVIAIYPITPSSPMGELSDEWSAKGRKNIWGTVPLVTELQSEGGASGAVHGALTTGALTTTFTASQGLLLMLPNMFKIAGELCPTVFHVTARSLACQALSIFGDHSDVMTARTTGFGLMPSASIQEIMDFALIAQAATLKARVPFVHFFDGFRLSHEIQKIERLSYDDMHNMIDSEYVIAHRMRGLNPENPRIRGTSQNPDVYFTARETVNRYYNNAPGIVQEYMDKFAAMTGRQYHLFDFIGADDAERVVVLMGSGAEAMEEVVSYLAQKGEKVGVVKVRLFRPFSPKDFIKALPKSVKAIAVLDRTKEPGAIGEPLYEDVRTAVGEAMGEGYAPFNDYPKIVGGRFGLGSAEFNAGMAKSVLDNLKQKDPKNHFTVGIHDDVTSTNLPWDENFSAEPKGMHKALFYGLGADGTVSANKNSIKIIGEATDNYAQGYFVYDSKKAGAMTVSHLRFGKDRIQSTYLLGKASFLACHKFSFLEKYDMLSKLETGGVFLLNSPYSAEQIWKHIPQEVQKQIIDKKVRFYIINAIQIATDLGLGARINTIMQAAFFIISGILPKQEAVSLIKESIVKTYGRKGKNIIDMNMKAVDEAIKSVEEVSYPKKATSTIHMLPPVPDEAPKFVKEVTGEIIANRGRDLPVSKLPDDGTYPTGTTKYEKRNIADFIPVWNPKLCIQCAQCSFACPHATIRVKFYDPKHLKNAPPSFKSVDARAKKLQGMKFTVQVAPEDCTGCGVCANICPGVKRVDGQKTNDKALMMEPQIPLREKEAENWDYFLAIPDTDTSLMSRTTIIGSQLLPSLFEFSGACAGCGETPYVKLVSQLFGDRAIIGNATGCSSIYGGNLPTTPYTTRKDGRGPVWSNSLFEDTAEFGFGMRLTSDKLKEHALEIIDKLLKQKELDLDKNLLKTIKNVDQSTPEGVEAQRKSVAKLKKALKGKNKEDYRLLLSLADYLIQKSVWLFGGDGWAYDIGYGGLDHILASGKNVNALVLDTEVYSNTGGQMSKSTPVGAIAKFAEAGKPQGKKDLGMMAITYGSVYVAKVALGANMNQCVKAFNEADAYNGTSLIIAYSHCIAQGIDMSNGNQQQKLAVDSGALVLFRYNPDLVKEGKNPLTIDSKEPSIDIAEYMYNENRFRALKNSFPERAKTFLEQAREDAKRRYKMYKNLAQMEV
ncbi:MAG: pyruvate:ferredoxin (flavodoxin) oxidoreductase [Spirochaetota bacterium]|nr:MAG: pyruvate:ferredoxin (flavodoxin) oxidoreductase [Spirochaetota bacterium]